MAKPRSEKPWAILSAILANVVIAVAKFAAGAVTGSSAMIAEGIHSLVDTGNGWLILLGQRRGARPPDRRHEFGHGKELYFWSLIVAILIFSLGGGMSVYEGVSHLRNPHPAGDPRWNYVVLAISLVSEGTSLGITWKEFRRKTAGRPLWRAIRWSKDPSIYAVLFEDSAAIAGILIAALGVFLEHRFGNPAFDGIASILIGILLSSVAILLARESRGLLVGESISAETLPQVRELIRGDPAVEELLELRSMYLGADHALVVMRVRFDPSLGAEEVAAAIARIKARLTERFSRIREIYVEPEPSGRASVA